MGGGAKYFVAESAEQAAQAAARHFGCAGEELALETVREGNEAMPWMVLARHGPRGTGRGSFALYYEADGVYLELYPPAEGGAPIDREAALDYVRRKALKLAGQAELSALLEQGWGRAQIAPAQEETVLGEEAAVTVSPDEMQAVLWILPPDPGGGALSEGAVREAMAEAGVVHGILEQAVQQALGERRYGTQYTVARGTEPVHGENGSLSYHFSTEKKTAAPKEMEHARVNYHELDLFEPVREGALLVTRTLPTAGTAGRTVKGKEIHAKPGREAVMPKSKNTVLDEDRTKMFAAKSGLVELAAGVVTVSDVYLVKGDCDMRVGNIDFDGSIVVTGNVISGLRLRASANITVGGVVEGAELAAGGNIELRRGMQGMDKGKISARGSVAALFIERASVSAGESLYADVVIHSLIEVGKSLYLKGKRGSIMGGVARVGGEVVSSNIGSLAHTQTDIEVGLLPQKRMRIQTLQKELARIEEEREKLEKLELYLTRAKGANLNGDSREELQASVRESKRQNAQLLEEYTEELTELEYEARNAVHGKVHVLKTAYPGAKISIATGTYRVDEQIQFATFLFRDGEITFVACEVKR